MNKRHCKTLQAVFAVPTKSNINWADIEALLIALGCNLIEGSGSRVRFEHKGFVTVFHRPHPAKEAKPYQVRDARKLMIEIGVTP
jgi:hypothetical protein